MLITFKGSTTNILCVYIGVLTIPMKSTAVCEGSQVSPTRPSDSSNKKLVNTTMVHVWNDTDREKQNYSEKNLSGCSSVHQKYHMNRTCGICVLL